jgi:hypothetical protein
MIMDIDYDKIKKELRDALSDDEEIEEIIEKIKSMSENDIIKIGEVYEYTLGTEYKALVEKVKNEIYKGEYPCFYDDLLKELYFEYHSDENEVNDNELIKFMQNPDYEDEVYNIICEFICNYGLLDIIIIEDDCIGKISSDLDLSEHIVRTILYYLELRPYIA